MSNHRIDWIVHRAVSAASGLLIRRRRDDGSLETFRSLLQERGFQVRELSLKDMSIERADTAVHVVHGLPPQELSMLLEQRQHASSLWIVRDEDQERIVLSALDRRHDAARLGTHPESLVARVLRLQVQEHMDVTVATALDRDRLTGLMDRRAFGRVLRREIANLLPGDQKALLHLDVDGFKRINDYFGHHVSDKKLCCISERLRDAAVPDYNLARIVGD
jgi:GGDEF domain-containing protein